MESKEIESERKGNHNTVIEKDMQHQGQNIGKIGEKDRENDRAENERMNQGNKGTTSGEHA